MVEGSGISYKNQATSAAFAAALVVLAQQLPECRVLAADEHHAAGVLHAYWPQHRSMPLDDDMIDACILFSSVK